MGFFVIVIANWALKLFVGWLMYSIATSLAAPEWVVIVVTAVGAVESKVTFSWE